MVILTEAEKKKVIEYRSEGQDFYKITHQILEDRENAIYREVRREVVFIIEDHYIGKILKDTQI